MPDVLTLPSIAAEAPPRKKFTRGEFEWMIDSGVFAGQRLELIDEELIDKTGQNPPHAHAIRRLTALLIRAGAPDRLMIQLPIEAGSTDRDRSVPEPDLAVLSRFEESYARRHPAGSDLTLAVEVSDTTVRHDALTKRDLYARAGVPEYWVLDLSARKLRVYRRPQDGEYQETSVLGEGDSVAFEGAQLTVADMLPTS